MMSRLLRALRRYLVTGLLVWVPLGVTLLTFRFLLDLADEVLPLLPARWQPDALLGFHVPGFGAIVALVVLLGTGILLRNLLGSTLVSWWEDLMNRIPLVRSIYSGAKGITETLVSDKGGSFSKVVLVEYPRRDSWSIGFVTAADVPDVDAVTGRKVVCVYMPTTPNPTSGFILYVPVEDVRETDMSTDAAMKMVVTMGMVMPPPKHR
ncbi:MAG TPA: DUF502 domain-containing protein [Steroidobacteraceae bacterium]|nr:DUF502 domain-containing protein [Steroidobacteraceae bacterium]